MDNINTLILKKFIVSEKSFEQAIDGFWKYVTTWYEDEPDEFFDAFQTFDFSSIFLKNEKVALVINYRFDEPIEYVQTSLTIIVLDRTIGSYQFLQTLDGKALDDGIHYD